MCNINDFRTIVKTCNLCKLNHKGNHEGKILLYTDKLIITEMKKKKIKVKSFHIHLKIISYILVYFLN